MDLRHDVLVPEESLVAVVAAWLLRQKVGLAVVGAAAQRSSLRAVDRVADKIAECLTRVRLDFGSFGRAGAEHGRDVDGRVLELDVGGGHAADDSW